MTQVFSNRLAGFLWGFAVVWLAMLLTMTWVTVRDGAPADQDPRLIALLLVLFWAAGIALAVHVSSRPCISVHVHAGQYVRVRWTYPFKVVEKDFPRSRVKPAKVIETRDSDGDPYFLATAGAVGEPSFDFAESHLREYCESARDRFNVSLFGHRSPP